MDYNKEFIFNALHKMAEIDLFVVYGDVYYLSIGLPYVDSIVSIQ